MFALFGNNRPVPDAKRGHYEATDPSSITF